MSEGQRRLEEAVARLAEEQRRMWRALCHATRHIEMVSMTLEGKLDRS